VSQEIEVTHRLTIGVPTSPQNVVENGVEDVERKIAAELGVPGSGRELLAPL